MTKEQHNTTTTKRESQHLPGKICVKHSSTHTHQAAHHPPLCCVCPFKWVQGHHTQIPVKWYNDFFFLLDCDTYQLQCHYMKWVFFYISALKNQCFSMSLFMISLLFTDAYTFQNKNMGSCLIYSSEMSSLNVF